MGYQVVGLTTLHEWMQDFVVYRNLEPADARLPSAAVLRGGQGVPRKAEPEYGQVAAAILRHARALDLPRATIRRLLYIGDTEMNDGTAFRNMCAAGGWPGWAFIGRDTLTRPPDVSIRADLYLANRWSALPAFLAFVEEQGFGLDEETAVVIDIDKTAIGARGRNDRVIDRARVEGVQRTVADLLGPSFDQEAFQQAYDELNQPAYHPFTADNQDYVAYLCLILGAGLMDLEMLVGDVRAGRMCGFGDFIAWVQSHRAALDQTGLATIHDEVWQRVQEGDPTPFKAFRYNEYLTTVTRFGDLPGALPEEVLAQRIAITQEVREAGLSLRARGALILGVSDKPDEASLPREDQARAGMRALHRLETLAVGEEPPGEAAGTESP
jgi:hypothetical protein